MADQPTSGSPRSPHLLRGHGTWALSRDHAPADCTTITREIAVRKHAPSRPGATTVFV